MVLLGLCIIRLREQAQAKYNRKEYIEPSQHQRAMTHLVLVLIANEIFHILQEGGI